MVEEKPIDVEKWEIGRLENEIQTGEIRVPRFQREFVWERSKVVKLLQSIYDQYPIGSFFLWEADPKYNKFFKNIEELNVPPPKTHDKITFILDGQQRITSIYMTLNGMKTEDDDFSKISFDLDDGKFIVETPDNKKTVSVSDIFSESKHLQIFDELTKDRKVIFEKCRTRFSNYPFSIVRVMNKGLEEAIDIFELINQSGKRLRLFDLVAASTWTEEFDIREKISDFNKEFVKMGFGELEPEIVTETLSLVLKEQCTRAYQLMLGTDITVSTIEDIWKPITESIKLAIDFLKNNLGVEKYEFLPYRDIVPLIAYFYHKSNKRRMSSYQKEKISEWFWKVAFSERYSSSTFTRMGDDRTLIDKLIDEKNVRLDYTLNITEEKIKETKMNRETALRNAVLCILSINNH
jgi:hypothetical protein